MQKPSTAFLALLSCHLPAHVILNMRFLGVSSSVVFLVGGFGFGYHVIWKVSDLEMISSGVLEIGTN